MANITVKLPIGYYPDPSIGRPVSNGYLYVGEPDTDPTVALNQKQLYVLEEDGSETSVSQPLRTGQGGVILYNGSPVTVYVDGNHSMKVLDSGLSQVYYVPSLVDQGQGLEVGWIDFDLTPSLPVGHQAGRLYWNTTTKTLTLMLEDDVSIDLGMAEIVRVHNDTGAQIAYGQAVYPTGDLGGVSTIALAKADAIATAGAFAFTLSAIADGTSGYALTSGKMPALDTSGFTSGETVYLSDATAGALTDTAPTIETILGFTITPSLGAGVIQVRTEPAIEPADAALFSDKIQGMAIENDSGDLEHDITFNTGQAYDASLATLIELSAAITKMIDDGGGAFVDNEWQEGTDKPGMDDGVAAAVDTWYYCFVIAKADGTTDAIFSTSPTVPNPMPTGYTLHRRVGAILTDGSSNILAFRQFGSRFRWDIPKSDESTRAIHTAQTARAISVPDGIEVEALFHLIMSGSGGTNSEEFEGLVLDPRDTDTAPTAALHNAIIVLTTNGDVYEAVGEKLILTNDGTVNVRWSGTPTSGTATYGIVTTGWNDDRSV